MSNYIVAIDLGTSHITGIVGEKKTDGKFSIISYESVETDTCIHRGIIYDSDETATHIANLLTKLERNLKGAFIDKVYIGVGGQSLHTIDHIEAMDIMDGVSVTEDDIAALKEKCVKYKPDLKDVLGLAHTVYYMDGQKCAKPVGVLGNRFEAYYKLVVGRSSIRHRITKSIEAIRGKSLAGMIVAPLALANAVLSPRDKELGCALVDFGAGVTSVTIFKDGDLQHLFVIPLGGKLITRDITSLQLTKEDAEKLKKKEGSAILHNEDENKLIRIEMEGGDLEIKLSELNMIIEGRAKEIIENVHARICDVIKLQQLGAGIVLAGRGTDLTNLPELLEEKCRVKVRISPIQIGLVEGSDEMLGNPLYMMAISLMLQGTESCVSSKEVEDSVILPDNNNPATFVVEVEKPDNPPKGASREGPKKNRKSIKEKIGGIFDLFGEE